MTTPRDDIAELSERLRDRTSLYAFKQLTFRHSYDYEAGRALLDEAATAIDALQARVKELEAQLPEGMKHCTITFRECEVGHGRLSATNWIDNGCHWCTVASLRRERDEARAALEAETDRADENSRLCHLFYAALKPFAEAASEYDEGFPNDKPTWGDYGLTLGHLRAARAVIKQGPEWHGKDHWENEP